MRDGAVVRVEAIRSIVFDSEGKVRVSCERLFVDGAILPQALPDHVKDSPDEGVGHE